MATAVGKRGDVMSARHTAKCAGGPVGVELLEWYFSAKSEFVHVRGVFVQESNQK